MRTKHVTQTFERYLDDQLPASEKRLIEEHLSLCPTCARHFFHARRLRTELGPVMQAALGRPRLPAALRRRVHQHLNDSPKSRLPRLNWAGPGRILNGLGTLAVLAVLALAAFTVIQSQVVDFNDLSNIEAAQPGEDIVSESIPLQEVITPTVQAQPTKLPIHEDVTLGDTLKIGPVAPESRPSEPDDAGIGIASDEKAVGMGEVPLSNRLQKETAGLDIPGSSPGRVKDPEGTIAFSYFNAAAYRQAYETHLISPDGTNHRIFPLDGVSEPALRLMGHGYQLASRAWSEPTAPRALLVSNLEGRFLTQISNFWEDAQPDWSPIEHRVIFASQRESDRHWRLYTNLGDGSEEINLRREGKSPTFAPDGYRFAFESCDDSANRCGLWLGDLDHSEYDSRPFLEDPLARSPDWSPVDEEIAYMANPDGNWDLYLVNSNGRNVRRLTDNPAIDGLPVWSPDGEWLAFLSDRGGNWGIWLLHPGSAELRQVFDFDGGTFTPPTRPPYGERHWWDEQISWSE